MTGIILELLNILNYNIINYIKVVFVSYGICNEHGNSLLPSFKKSGTN